jgi:hypothetical protein
MLPRSLPEVIVIVTGNLDNRDNLECCSSCCGAAKIIPTCVTASAKSY